ncbi:MAG: YeeE/YedE family protein [Cyclobacteriaceae bacterium]|nr:YeeE/YedE family protein [Cyclobacteriaceae bacterium]
MATKPIHDEFTEQVTAPDECSAGNDQVAKESLVGSNIKYLGMGILFGIIAVKSEIISWYRIQEMFRLHSFHMYGVIGTAVVVGAISVWLIKRFKIKTLQGETAVLHPRQFHWGNVIGGLLFGIGWGITGACPGPLFAQIGSGSLVVVITLLSAIAGTYVYGIVQKKLPH